MKKILAMILAMLLVLSMGVVAFADGEDGGEDGGESGTTTPTVTYTDTSTITITKKYTATNGGVSPAETFSFSDFTQVDIKENDAATWPSTKPAITSITYAEGEATADGTGTGTKTAKITLPTYTAVGIYTYSFTEVTPTTKTAGVTYNGDTLYLVVTVVEQNGKVRVAAVHCEGDSKAGTYGKKPKTDVFNNSYESGTLAVTKTVTGNLGDKTKYFDVTVTFTVPEAAEGETAEQLKSAITYSGGKYTTAQSVPNTYIAEIQVKDGDTVTFSNIPEGATWTVTEADYTGEGYDAAQYSTQTAVMKAGGAATSTITNNKTADVDTGIILQYAPYIAVLAIVLAGAILLVIRRRRNNED